MGGVTQRLHEKGSAAAYPGGVCVCSSNLAAGLEVLGMPDYQAKRFVLDAAVEKYWERIYGEVEFGYGKETKWWNMQDTLGYVAFCTRSPGHERVLLEGCGDLQNLVYTINLAKLTTREGE